MSDLSDELLEQPRQVRMEEDVVVPQPQLRRVRHQLHPAGHPAGRLVQLVGCGKKNN